MRQIERGIASALTSTESLRTLDRLRLRASLSDEEVATRRATILRLVASLELVELDEVVLERAAQPMPTELGTLDALHLATAVLCREMSRADLVMATHDTALGMSVTGLAGHRRSSIHRAFSTVIGCAMLCLRLEIAVHRQRDRAANDFGWVLRCLDRQVDTCLYWPG